VSPVRYKLGFYIAEDDILHSHCRENLKSYILFQLRIFSSVTTDERFRNSVVLLVS
jgi:hypothetical protein